MIFALNLIEKYIKEKWDTIEDIKVKKVIRNYLLNNINERLNCINENLSDKKRQYFMTSINKLDYIIVLIASKDWPKSWPNLINELCDGAKMNISYNSENCIKILLLLNDHINKSYEKLMTAKKTIELTCKMYNELNKIFSVVKYFIVEKSYEFINFIKNANNNNINNNNGNKDLIINIFKQAIKLYNEFIVWFDIDNIIDKNVIESLLSILKIGVCKNEIIGSFGSLFKVQVNKLRGENIDEMRTIFFDFYDSFMNLFHNNIIKRKNFIEQYELISKNEPEKILGFENFTVLSENCLINFFNENFNFIKEKSISSPQFLNKYINNFIIGLEYILQFTNFRNDQIKNNAIEFWYFIVSDLFTLKKDNKNSYNSNSSISENSLNSTNNNSVVEEKEILVDYLKNSYIYNYCFGKILNKLRELLCETMTKPLELKIKIDENGDIISAHNENDLFNQSFQETKQNILKYLSLIEPEMTKNFIIKKIVEQNNQGLSSINLNKINSLCWSSGIIVGTMNETIEREFVISICKILFIMIKNSEERLNEALSYNLMFIISKYIKFINKHDEFPFAVIKKLLEFFQSNSTYVKDFACETFFRLSNYNEDLIQNKDYAYEFIDFLLNDLKEYTQSLNDFQIIMVYESLANIISKVNDQNLKGNYFKKLMKKPNESFIEVINNKDRNINYLNNLNVMKSIKILIVTNERICNSFKTFYWFYGITIFKEIINIYIYYNDKLNELINNNCNNGINKEKYELVNTTILKYFISLVKNINDINIIKNDMLMNYGILLGIFSTNPNNNKNPNLLLLFAAIIEVFKNNNYEITYKIWDFFYTNIFNLLKESNNSFPEITENFFKLVNSLVTHSLETFYFKYKSIPNNLIDVINYGVNSDIPTIYELSLETLCILLEKMSQININGMEQTIIIKEFYFNYFKKIFYFVFNNMIDGLHQNGIKTQIKILRIMVNTYENKDIFDRENKINFQNELKEELIKLGKNLTQTQIITFTLALFNYSSDEHYFELTIQDFLVSINSFSKKDESVSEEEKKQQILLSRELELKKYLSLAENNQNISIDNYLRDDFLM